MANLISRRRASDPFSSFDESQRARFEERARCLSGLDWPADARALVGLVEAFPVELEELETAPSLAAVHELLDRIDRVRRSMLRPSARSSVVGDWLCYLPGRSLATGEAQIASRGFFDELDRPPLGLWIEAIGRPASGASGADRADELAILCFVPEAARELARAGREACGTSSLAAVEALSPALSSELREIDLACLPGPAGSSGRD